jgi:hypothetical protein
MKRMIFEERVAQLQAKMKKAKALTQSLKESVIAQEASIDAFLAEAQKSVKKSDTKTINNYTQTALVCES